MASDREALPRLSIARCVCLTITGGALDVKDNCPVHTSRRGADGIVVLEMPHELAQALMDAYGDGSLTAAASWGPLDRLMSILSRAEVKSREVPHAL